MKRTAVSAKPQRHTRNSEKETFMIHRSMFALTFAAAALAATQAAAQVPAPIAAPGESVIATFHAQGAQVYECKAAADGKLAWAFREPIATLLLDGKTVGRHYAGPNWDHVDEQRRHRQGARQRARQERRMISPGSSSRSRHSAAAASFPAPPPIQRINTVGGVVKRRLRQSRQLPQRALRRRLRVPAQGTSDAPARAHAL